MSTFIGQLVGFAVIVWLIVRFVVPPVRKMMADQQNTVRQQLADSSAAADRLAEASRAHAKAKEDANAEAKRLTEEAQSDAERIGEQMRAQADSDAERIKQQGGKQVELMRCAVDPAAASGHRCRIRPAGRRIGARIRRRTGSAVRDRRPFPGRSRRDGGLDGRNPVPRREQDAFGQPAGADGSAGQVRVRSPTALTTKGLSTLADDLTSVAALLIRESRGHPLPHAARRGRVATSPAGRATGVGQGRSARPGCPESGGLRTMVGRVRSRSTPSNLRGARPC